MANDRLFGILLVDYKPEEGLNLANRGGPVTNVLKAYLEKFILRDDFLNKTGARISLLLPRDISVKDLGDGTEEVTFRRRIPREE